MSKIVQLDSVRTDNGHIVYGLSVDGSLYVLDGYRDKDGENVYKWTLLTKSP